MNLSTSAILGLLVMVAATGLVDAEGKFFCSKDRPEAFCTTPHPNGNGEEYDMKYLNSQPGQANVCGQFTQNRCCNQGTWDKAQTRNNVLQRATISHECTTL
ncbi:hypothetical protein PGT21_029087 [Puccinia graminis f. sp. tritici]|uniref:Uncharacterized protein n=1 Tax=Puccinia graminis f. sp. tritici TaxID=56615 RepID=A0A5B0LIX0_PUCGR|nr:hypothetical protein PGTUg99_004721 [Puccinia graminis f. sp. tritici]KAA1117981.1 hypothetical protein PGT21_029087 [Puccinia graminis f. sp. tritici]